MIGGAVEGDRVGVRLLMGTGFVLIERGAGHGRGRKFARGGIDALGRECAEECALRREDVVGVELRWGLPVEDVRQLVEREVV